MTSSDHRLTRRGALRGLGGTGLGLAGLGLFGPQHFEDEAFSATPSCTLVAEQEEGPYYLDLEKVRKNITGGKSGIRLDLRVKVVDSSSCRPLSDVAVDIWHAAANGKYSGFSELSPYSSRTITRVRNKADHIYTQQGGAGSILSLTAREKSSIRSGFVGRIALGVDPGAT